LRRNSQQTGSLVSPVSLRATHLIGKANSERSRAAGKKNVHSKRLTRSARATSVSFRRLIDVWSGQSFFSLFFLPSPPPNHRAATRCDRSVHRYPRSNQLLICGAARALRQFLSVSATRIRVEMASSIAASASARVRRFCTFLPRREITSNGAH